ncbi:cysteine desulfurase family protein [Nocardioides sp. MAHUQ-72]|uniref:cysteine desulfurase family protein n=1 Tax=unclassified Nocardioides TaxID=2615069 RepID=UPI003620BE70
MTNAAGAPGPVAGRRHSAYLDSASSEPLHPAARDVLLAALDQGYADPRRLHGAGRSARLLLDNAREVVAQCLGVRRDEVTFTSSGTDAVHRGLLGLVAGNPVRGSTAVLSSVEHSAVRHAVSWLARRDDAAPVQVPVDGSGRVDADAFVEACLAPGVAVAALQAANHEVATTQPVPRVAERLAGSGVPLLVDACAAAGRLDLPSGWTAAAASAHKWGGPAGVGLLLLRKGARWGNPFPGEMALEDFGGGFPDVPGALAAAAALQAVVAERDGVNARHVAMVDRIRDAAGAIPDVEVVGDPVDRLPHLVTFSCLYVDGEALVTELDRRGFGVASGSACTASTLEPSHVLTAMGVLTHGNVRVSLTRDTTEEDVDGFLRVLPEVVRDIRAEVGL